MYEDRTYAALLAEGKAQVSDNILKTEGSLVHNAISIVAYEQERFYIQADYLLRQLYPETADYENLEKMCAKQNVYPKDATFAEVKLVGDAEIPIGARFNLSAYNYTVIEKLSKYEYIARCETAGSAPNSLTGPVTPITFVNGLNSAKITEVTMMGSDKTTREQLLAQFKASFDSSSFCGNVAEYKLKLNAMDGIGGCKIYPVWKGGGTVKAVLISSEYGPVSEHLVSEIQEKMCPTPKAGYGIAGIGHDMMVVSVEEVTATIATRITFMTGFSWSTCEKDIKAAIADYINSQRKTWADGDEHTYITIYVSRLESAILSVSGVLDIGDTTINGATSNLVLRWDQIPKIGTVTVS